MQHLKIAFYTDSYFPAVDGVVTSICSFKSELERRGHKVYIFAPATAEDKKKYERKDVFLYAGVKFKPYPQYSTALFPYYSSIKLKDLGVDIIHNQTPFMMGFTGLLAAKLNNYPVVSTFHTLINSRSLDSYYPKNRALRRFYSKYLWKYVKFFYRSSDRVIAPSNAIALMLRKHKIGNVAVVPNSVDLKRFNTRVSGTPALERLGISREEKVVLYIGRVSREKNLDVMLKAAKLLLKKRNDVRFVVGGTGPALEEQKRLANRLGIASKLTFTGFVSKTELPQMYAASDMLCLPSNFETQGIVALEAMAAGKPVVGSDYMALRDLIKDGKNGEKFKPSDARSCAKKIEKVLNNSSAYKKHATETARQYSSRRVTDALLDTYNLLLTDQAVN